MGRAGLAAPIYATHPVQKMGEMFMYEAYLAHHQVLHVILTVRSGMLTTPV